MRDRGYFQQILKKYRVEDIRTSKDVDEIMRVIIDSHRRSGHMLSNKDILLLRSTIRESIPEAKSRVAPGIVRIENITPDVSRIQINMTVPRELSSIAKLGGIAVPTMIKTVGDLALKQCRDNGIYYDDGDALPEEIDLEKMMNSGLGKMFMMFGEKLTDKLVTKAFGS